MKSSADKHFAKLLNAAYHYYWLDDPLISDDQYDHLARCVYVLRDEITHPKKELVDWDSLSRTSSLFYIPKGKYVD